MQHKFDSVKFAKDIRTKRLIEKEISMEKLAEQIGVAQSTASRIENQVAMPDLLTYSKICSWLGVDMSKYIIVVKPSSKTKNQSHAKKTRKARP